MKKLLVLILALGSLTAFAQRYGGSTYYNYGTIPMSDAVHSNGNSSRGTKFRIFHYSFLENTINTVIDSDNVCVTGLIEYGNRTTNQLEAVKLSYLKRQPCYESGDYIEIETKVGSEWLLNKNEKPHFSGSVATVDLEKNVETRRCVKLKDLKRIVKKINRKSKKYKCSESTISLNGELINI